VSAVTEPTDDAYLACLAGLDRMTSSRLASLLAHHEPRVAHAVVTGEAVPSGPIRHLLERNPELRASWRAGSQRWPPSLHEEALRRSQVTVLRPADPAFPPQLLDDPRCPAVLFIRGDPEVLASRRVGIVGTRNATHRGRETAARIGFELAGAGVAVVSGLAIGIDGAAHRGALAADGAPPVAIVGSGPDVAYPVRHTRLWERVACEGLLISEWPPGTKPDAFRFPLRNRLIAALSEVVIVVESRERGGSLITAREAAERGVDVFAVPGSLDSPASAGANQLLRDGAAALTETSDVLLALGLDTGRAGRQRVDRRPIPRGLEAQLLERCRQGATTIEQIVTELDLELSEAALALARLERSGWVREVSGWFEACDVWADLA
jgi:DNA processing protein